MRVQYTMSSNRSLQDRLAQQASAIFSREKLVSLSPEASIYLYTPQLQKRLPLSQFYTHLNVHFLQHPQSLLAYVEKSPPSTINITLYLESLRALTQIYRYSVKYSYLKQLYLALARIPKVRQCMARDCSVPEDIAQAMEGLDKGGKGNKDDGMTDLQTKSVAYSKLVLLASLLNHNSGEQVETIWLQMSKIMEEGRVDGLKVFDQVMGSVMGRGDLSLCSNLLGKFEQMLGTPSILNHLLIKLDNDYYNQGQKLLYRGQLSSLLQDNNISIPPNQQTLKMLCLMTQRGTVKLESVFPLLTPSVQFLSDVAEMHIDFHEEYVKRCWQHEYEGKEQVAECLWGELVYSSKLQLLNQFLLLNDYKSFSRIIDRQGLKLDLIYHPRLIATLTLLLQWIVDPLYRRIGYASYFPPIPTLIHFPPGSFQQCLTLSNYLLQTIAQLLNIGKSYIFAQKTTFTKLCRILKSVCHSKDSRISVESQEVGRKVGGFTANLVKRHILPAVQYYGNDPSVAFQLDRLMDCFRFKVQLQIYLHVIREQRLSNLHLAINYHQVAKEQIKLLNRLSPNAKQIINRMAALMASHPFSALDPIFKRIQLNAEVLLSTICSAMHRTPRLTKKVALFHTFLYLFQENKPEYQQKYAPLVEFTKQLLLHQRQPDDFVRTIVEYIASRFSHLKEDLSLQAYSKEISFLTDLLKGFVPIQLEDNFVSKNNNCKYLVGGPCLKVWIMERTEEFCARDGLRRSLMGCMFRSGAKELVENYFFYLLLKLNNRLIIVSQSLQGHLNVSGEIYDRILTLMLNLINIVHFQMTPPILQRYFALKIFKSLTNHYKLPYQLGFYVIRRLITVRMQGENYNWVNKQTWEGLKTQLQGPLQLYFQESAQFKEFKANSYSHEAKTAFFRTDIFLLFWIQQTEYAHFTSKTYDICLSEIDSENSRAKLSHEVITRMKKDIFGEKEKYEELHSKLKEGKGRRAIKDQYWRKLKGPEGGQEDILNFVGLLIKYCIFPRSTLNKSQCYYSWLFYLQFIVHNKYPTIITVKLLCLLLESICSYIPFATLRQATELLPLLYNCAIPMVKWKGLPECTQKLFQCGLALGKTSPQEYDELERIVYQSQNQVIKMLFDNKGLDPFSVKNCLHFAFLCSYIPFFKEHADAVTFRLTNIKNHYMEDPGLGTMADRLSTQIENRCPSMRTYSKAKSTKLASVKCWQSIRMNQESQSETNEPPVTIDVETTSASDITIRSKKKSKHRLDSSIAKPKKSSKSKTKKDLLNMTSK